MKEKIIFFIAAFFVFIIDQIIKIWILDAAKISNPIIKTDIIDIVLVYNKGVAFSLGIFLGNSLKWIILTLLVITIVVIMKSNIFFKQYYVSLGVIIGAGFGNLIDRFLYNGVVDYIYWHYGFNFAVFNFADTSINIAIAYLLAHNIYMSYKNK